MRQITELHKHLQWMARQGAALGLLGWDEEVNLPPKAHQIRGEVKSQLAADLHKRVTSPKFVGLVKDLAHLPQLKKLKKDDQIIIRETWRDVEKAQKLPVKFVEEFTQLTTEAFATWNIARQKSDFSYFQPVLKKVLNKTREQAQLLGYENSPYDALLDIYEPNMTSQRLNELFNPLRDFLTDLIKQVDAGIQPNLPKATYPIEQQVKLNRDIAAKLGYDFKAGRIDESPHPFSINFHPTDVRITTRYDKSNFWVSLGSTIHEVGHALYEQGLAIEDFGTPLGESVSLGIHESQSRLWENFVCRSKQFVDYLYGVMDQYFAASSLRFGPEELYRWLNRVQPSLIRVEADEVTYNLHIILRYELEKALLENRLEVEDLPAAWNQKMRDYLGISVPNDAKGVLQDIHWAHGSLGYFPTYSLGNIYAAQLYHQAEKNIPDMGSSFARGEFGDLLKWLRWHIHTQGRRYLPEQLIKRATGEGLNSKYLQQHLKKKVKLQLP